MTHPSPSTPGRTLSPCRCVYVEHYGFDRTACRADEHNDTNLVLRAQMTTPARTPSFGKEGKRESA